MTSPVRRIAPDVIQQSQIYELQRLNETLRLRVVALEAELARQVERSLDLGVAPFEHLGLSPTQARIFSKLMSTGFVSRQGMEATLLQDGPERSSNRKSIGVHVFNIRKKLDALGIVIENIHGRGYRISDDDRAKVLDLMAPRPMGTELAQAG